jgi:aminomethyltransferase
MKYTSLHPIHKKMQAKMTNFAGFEMPLYYSSIIKEHLNVRKNVGIFDVSHMGDIIVSGKEAKEYLSYLFPASIWKMKTGQAKYTCFLNKNGLIIDDTIVTKLEEEKYLIVPNASNTDKILNWMNNQTKKYDVNITDISNNISCIAVQGPSSPDLIKHLFNYNLKSFEVSYHNYEHESQINKLFKEKNMILLSKTGYTGEKGFEIMVNNSGAEKIWLELMTLGKEYEIMACGLGSRDTLRMEKGFLLSGQDFKEDRTPTEAGISWTISWEHDFIGKNALSNHQPEEIFMGFIMQEKGLPRHGCEIYSGHEKIGIITSGTISPILNCGIGLGYIKKEYAEFGRIVEIEIRGKRIKSKISKPKMI